MTGEGSMRSMAQVTLRTRPMRPCRTSAIACRNRLSDSVRCIVPTWNTLPVSPTTFSISFPSAIVSVSGFSQ